MNIGIVTAWFPRGAAYVSRAYRQTLAREHQVHIYARGGERFAIGDPEWDREYVTWGKRVPWKTVTYVDWRHFLKWVRDRRLDVVIFNEQHSWDVIVRIRKRLDLIIGAYVDYYTLETVPFFWLYDFLLCNTKRHYSVFADHPHAFYIPWGTDLELFKPQMKPTEGEEVVFFHSCGVSPLRKGTDLLLKAFRRVEGPARLVIHSQSALDGDKVPLSLIAQDVRIEVIVAEVSGPGLYHLGDVYVYPSRLEGIGLTIAEALASGLPVITTDVPPMNEFVEDGVNGKLVQVERTERREDNYYWPQSVCSESGLAEAMQFYVDNRHLIRQHQQAAREYAEAKLDWRENSRALPQAIDGISHHPASCDPRLLEAAVEYERSRYHRPYPFVLEPVVDLLRRAGLR